jgi:hypothetical protein
MVSQNGLSKWSLKMVPVIFDVDAFNGFFDIFSDIEPVRLPGRVGGASPTRPGGRTPAPRRLPRRPASGTSPWRRGRRAQAWRADRRAIRLHQQRVHHPAAAQAHVQSTTTDIAIVPLEHQRQGWPWVSRWGKR